MVREALARCAHLRQTGFQMIFVKYHNGQTRQGVLLTLGGQSIRVALQGCDDVVEYRQINGRWISEDCEVVTFDFSERLHDTEDPQEVPAIYASAFHPQILRIM
jgi:hypothetical protein